MHLKTKEIQTITFKLGQLPVKLGDFLCVGYDVQSASTRNGMLYITGAPRYNHTGRVTIYRFDGQNITITQTLEGKQVGLTATDTDICLLTLFHLQSQTQTHIKKYTSFSHSISVINFCLAKSW